MSTLVFEASAASVVVGAVFELGADLVLEGAMKVESAYLQS
jgi:hypothetical protein